MSVRLRENSYCRWLRICRISAGPDHRTAVEHIFAVDPLPTNSAGYDVLAPATALFVDRAGAKGFAHLTGYWPGPKETEESEAAEAVR